MFPLALIVGNAPLFARIKEIATKIRGNFVNIVQSSSVPISEFDYWLDYVDNAQLARDRLIQLDNEMDYITNELNKTVKIYCDCKREIIACQEKSQ